MVIEKNEDSPLGIPASKKNQDAAYKETHRYVEKGRYYEDAAEEAREEIAERYQIPIENIAVYPEIEGRKREIRIFMVLENLKTGERFYADGHVPHAIVLNYIFQKFPKIGIGDRFNLPLNWEENWKTRKGFIDPYMNGFRDFPTTRSAIIKAMDENEQNGLSQAQVVELKKDPKNGDSELPNWIKSI
jgi:hypothetical protein